MLVSSRTTRASEPRATTMSFSATSRSPANRRAVAQDRALEGHPRLEREPARQEQLEHLLEIRRLDLREEADLADVDPEQRHVVADHGPGGAKERPVAAQHHEHVRAGQLAMEGLAVRRRRRAHSSSRGRVAQSAARSHRATAASLVGL